MTDEGMQPDDMIWGESTTGYDGKLGIAGAYGVSFLRGKVGA